MLLWNIIERHLDEAEFLWGLWEHSLAAPNYTLEEVARGPEARLLAHVDGLVVNGPEAARRLLIPGLAHDEPRRVSAAAMALLHSSEKERVEAVVTALRTQPLQRSALTRAMACAGRPDVLARMHELLADPDPAVSRAASEVLLFHHALPATALQELLESADPERLLLGLQALPSAPASLPIPTVLRSCLEHEDPRVAAAALEAGCVLGFGPAWQCARERASGADKTAMLLLALAGGPPEHSMLLSDLGDAERRLGALWALGFAGTPEVVDGCMDWLSNIQAGPLAGEVFTAVTGVDLTHANLAASPEETESLDHTPEEDLPRPDPVQVRGWWASHRKNFVDGQRYLLGVPRSPPTLIEALVHAPMRRRPALLLDLRLHLPAGPSLRLQTRAPTRQQYAELSALQSLAKTRFNSSRPLL